jgi:hypothetical protein
MKSGQILRFWEEGEDVQEKKIIKPRVGTGDYYSIPLTLQLFKPESKER